MRTNVKLLKDLNQYTGHYYVSVAAYFGQLIRNPWNLVSATTKHVSELTGEVPGTVAITGVLAEKVSTCKTISTRPIPAESTRSITDSDENLIRTALFEAASQCKGNNGQIRNRPKCVVLYESSELSRGAERLPHLQSLSINIRVDYLFPHTPTLLTDWFARLWNIIDRAGECAQGLAEFTCPDAGYSIGEYDQGGEGYCDWERRLAHARFIFDSDRLSKIRGVYWGTFIGRSIAVKLDTSGAFLERFNSLPFAGSISKPIGVATSNGGYWLQLNNDPLGGEPDSVHSDHIGIENALWLERELNAKGLLLRGQ